MFRVAVVFGILRGRSIIFRSAPRLGAMGLRRSEIFATWYRVWRPRRSLRLRRNDDWQKAIIGSDKHGRRSAAPKSIGRYDPVFCAAIGCETDPK
jgi:hypothetical protein